MADVSAALATVARSFFAMSPRERHDHIQADVSNVEAAMREATTRVRTVGDASCGERDAVKWVVDTCPYHAATMDMVGMLRETLAHFGAGEVADDDGCGDESANANVLCGHVPERASAVLDRLEQEVTKLVSAVSAHWDLIGELEVQPADSPTLVEAAALLESVRARVQRLDAETQQEIQSRAAIAEPLTASQWKSKPALMRYEASLQGIAADAELARSYGDGTCCDDGSALDRRLGRVIDLAKNMSQLLRTYFGLYC